MPNHIKICFHGELNDFLPAREKQRTISHEIKKARSVKDLIESIGIPHTEIDIILVNEQSVDFAFQLSGEEQIEVYPLTENLPLSPLLHNAPKIAIEPRFILDVHLGKLARYLRMLGFDTLYHNNYDDPELADISSNEQRILLTSDRKLLMRKKITRGYYMRSRHPKQQVKELLKHYKLFGYRPKFARCISCNGLIRKVKKEMIDAQLMPLTRKHYHEFFQCADCKKIYWEGSHYDKMQRLISQIKTP